MFRPRQATTIWEKNIFDYLATSASLINDKKKYSWLGGWIGVVKKNYLMPGCLVKWEKKNILGLVGEKKKEFRLESVRKKYYLWLQVVW
jgi:hypothetical protein